MFLGRFLRNRSALLGLEDPSKCSHAFSLYLCSVFLSHGHILAVGCICSIGVFVCLDDLAIDSISRIRICFVGIGTGFLFYNLREQKRRLVPNFTDAGGMTRLNLDGFTPDIEPKGLLGD